MQRQLAIRSEIFLADDIAALIVLIAEANKSILIDCGFSVDTDIHLLDRVTTIVIDVFRTMPATPAHDSLAVGLEIGSLGFVPPFVVLDETESVTISSIDWFSVVANPRFSRACLKFVILELQGTNATPQRDLIPIPVDLG